MNLKAGTFGVIAVLGWTVLACADVVRGKDLRDIIENQIRDNVRDSYGELAGENFSDSDLARFEERKVTTQVTALLEKNSMFLQAVDQVRRMSAADRAAYLKRCRLPLRKTWAELGKISPAGTTDAGRKAELAISKAVVDLAERIIAKQ